MGVEAAGATLDPGRGGGRGVSTGLVRPILRVASGNLLEMYDFIVFGFYARAIGTTFFPSRSAFVSLMASLATFWAAFLMRPLGAVVLGGVLDRLGRRAGLLLTLSLMSVGTVAIAATPSYAAIGIAAPSLVVAGRLLQGFSAGAELGGVSVYLAEIAPPGRRGLVTSFQSASQQVAVVFASGLGLLLSHLLPPAALDAWGWRIPFAVGCAIVPVLLLLRRGLVETAAFEAGRAGRPASLAASVAALRTEPAVLVAGTALVATTTVSFYFVTVYTPSFGRNVLHLPPLAGFAATFAVGLLNLLVLPLAGAASDRIGRRPVLFAAASGLLVLSYPVLRFAVDAPSLGRLLGAELVLAFLYATYNGAMVPHLAEIVPARIRASAFSVSYALAVALFGGATPALATLLGHAARDHAAPAFLLSGAALMGLAGAFATGPTRPRHPHRQAARAP